jgi:hypothetical protein
MQVVPDRVWACLLAAGVYLVERIYRVIGRGLWERNALVGLLYCRTNGLESESSETRLENDQQDRCHPIIPVYYAKL